MVGTVITISILTMVCILGTDRTVKIIGSMAISTFVADLHRQHRSTKIAKVIATDTQAGLIGIVAHRSPQLA